MEVDFLLSTLRCLGERRIISTGNKQAFFSKRTNASIHPLHHDRRHPSYFAVIPSLTYKPVFLSIFPQKNSSYQTGSGNLLKIPVIQVFLKYTDNT
jgi:hypothetical protein